METRVEELRYKEVISVSDGSRLGYVGDMELDLADGRITTLIIPGRRRLFGLLGREADRRIPWGSVRRFGDDIILVEAAPAGVLPEG
ncbi:MAG: YlmC/YmxH family sporulation protein [Lawsonibacter sp.]|nr:YlmC/YmxH family sporulation protein [Lawsonibacter sp.]